MLKESIVGYDPETGRVDHPPHQIFLESSSRCNLKCVHCSTDFGVPENEGMDMPLETVKRLAPWFEKTRFINLNGIGEPLLAANFNEIIELCGRGDAELSFNTNGMLLSDNRCDAIVNAGVNSIAISVDGWETHQSVRGVPYETVRSRILRLAEAKKRAGKDFPHLAVAYTLMKRNLPELPRMLEDLLPLGILAAVHVQPLVVFYEGLREENIYLAEDIDEIFKQCHAIAQKYDTHLMMTRSSLKLDESKTQEEEVGQLGSASDKFGCIDPFFQIQIQSSGNIVSCCYGLAPEKLNVREMDLEDVWNGEWYRNLRKNLYNKKFEGKCQNCPLIFGSQSTQVDSIRDGVFHTQNERFHGDTEEQNSAAAVG